MTMTGKLPTRKNPHAAASARFLATHSGAQIAHQSQLSDLRRLLADGEYQVDSQKLARQILARALGR